MVRGALAGLALLFWGAAVAVAFALALWVLLSAVR